MGWGRTNNLRGDSGDKKEGGAYKNELQKLALPAIDIGKCRNNPDFSFILCDFSISRYF